MKPPKKSNKTSKKTAAPPSGAGESSAYIERMVDKPVSGPQNALRRIGEDSLLRPFLSGLFDPQAYVRSIIRDGKSEECFNTIVECVESINSEIKKYISQHKDVLMSGMQDVATLADRYTSLADLSKTLQTNIMRLKKELSDSYGVVRARTFELERIHDACQLLGQAKQFAAAKAQLDNYLQDADDKDARSLATAAKTVAELEKLLDNPRLLGIKMIQSSAATIKAFASSIRVLAQSKLLEAIGEKNQAAMANYLQVFYNLDSLPEIVLLVIDHSVKQTLDCATDTLDLHHIHALYHDYQSKSSTSSSAPPSSAKKSSSSASLSAATPAASATPSAAAATGPSGVVTIVQLRIAIRELAHAWSNVIYDRATQVMVFQRVILKKEDPTSHEKFLDVLRRMKVSPLLPSSGSAPPPGATGAAAAPLHPLQQGQLLQLFWSRLSTGLIDLCHDKLRAHATVACRIYPYLRRAAIEVMDNVQAWNANDKQQDLSSSSTTHFLASLQVVQQRERNGLQSDADVFRQSEQVTGMFGSLLWGQFDLLGAMPRGYLSSQLRPSLESRASSSASLLNTRAATADHDLLEGLRPLKDRYLASALERMNVPILQMFPEVEGYTAAIPSRRDLQTLTKAIQGELTTVVIESDPGLVGAMSKELVKVVKLMLSKIEGMVLTTPETRKISLQNNFARSHAQEQNAQLFALLVQFKEILEAIPAQVMKVAGESSLMDRNRESAGGAGGKEGGTREDRLQAELLAHIQQATCAVDEAAYHILEGVVSLLAGYAESILLGMHKEGAVPAALTGPIAKPAMFSGLESAPSDCSMAVQTLVKQLPGMLRAYLLTLAKSPLLETAVEEFSLRMLQSYVSIAAVTRPLSEASRLRMAQDMATIEQSLSAFVNLSSIHFCPILAEYRAFRRLLFQDLRGKDRKQGAVDDSATPPDLKVLHELDFVHDLRPSTMLAYLICCGPTQLPLPYEALNKDIGYYIDGLLECPELAQPAPSTAKFSSSMLAGLRALYQTKKDGWKKVKNERRNWEDVQQALDVFFQRISVAEGERKANMRQWYEAVIDIGSHYFK